MEPNSTKWSAGESNQTYHKNTSYHQQNNTNITENATNNNNFMLLLDDFSDYFYNFNITNNNSLEFRSDIFEYQVNNCSSDSNQFSIDSNQNLSDCIKNNTNFNLDDNVYNYWALILVLFPFLTLFGNVLVILSVFRERTLQTVTNYFIVSLALADLLVAVVVMPFAVYVLFNGTWGLPPFVCDFYIAMDVICSTSSIFNLVAISIDRYIAVTQPIKYAKHKNNRRVWLTIVLVWAISMAIGSPIVLGLNNTPDRLPDLCLFYNSDFIIYSSLSSFYIPCIIMVFLYYNIFKALRTRAKKQRAARNKTQLSGTVIENINAQQNIRRVPNNAETVLGPSSSPPRNTEEERPTNTASGSNEEDYENEVRNDELIRSPEDGDDLDDDIDNCHVIVNDKSTEFMLATVVEEAGAVVAQLTSPPIPMSDPNGNNDSGYAPSNLEDTILQAPEPDSPRLPPHKTGSPRVIANKAVTGLIDKPKHGKHKPPPIGGVLKRNGAPTAEPVITPTKKDFRPLPLLRCGVEALARTGSSTSSSSKKERKASAASRFTIYKVHKASKKKREKSSAKKERKATKTLAIVLGVFLFCWVPFFTCNIMDAMCTKLQQDCQPGVTAFILTTWLGYINSFVNPVIYTIFNPEFRKAFKRLMAIGG